MTSPSSVRSAAFAIPSSSFTTRLAIAVVLCGLILFAVAGDYAGTGIFILSLCMYLFCADVFHRAALQDAASGRISFACLVSLSVSAAFAYSLLKTFTARPIAGLPENLYGECALLTVLALWVMRREVLKKERTHVFIKKLDDFLPKSARVLRERKQYKVFARELRPDDLILVRPGERIPCDGLVAKGTSAVNEGIITGNMLPASKRKGSRVFAGTLNKTDDLYITVTGLLNRSAVMGIVDAVKNSEIIRSPGVSPLDKASAWLVPSAVVLAGAAYAWALYTATQPDWAHYIGVFLIVLAFACSPALVFSVWLAEFFARGGARGRQIILQNPEALHRLAEAKTLFFDKTGTLTYGELRVSGVFAAQGVALKQLLEAAAAAEQQVDGPFAKAVNLYVAQHKVRARKLTCFDVLPGMGVLAVCGRDKIMCGRESWLLERGIQTRVEETSRQNPLICVAKNDRFLGYFVLSDTLRPGAAEMVSFLHERKKEVIVVSGDNEDSVGAVARQAGIEKMNFNVLPQTKAEIVNNLRALGQKVAMVGDGFNDIIALLRSDVSLVFFSGRNVYNNWVDIIIKRGDLSAITDLFALHKKMRRAVTANLVLSFLAGGALAAYVLFVAREPLAWYVIPGGLTGGAALIFFNSVRLLNIK